MSRISVRSHRLQICGTARLQHLVKAEYGGTFDLIEGDTGPGQLKHPLDHPVGEWL